MAKMHVQNQDIETLTDIPQWLIDEYDSYLDEDLCRLSIYAPSPGLMADVDGDKLAAQA
ncbi:aminopeptidase [Erysipelothrix sp. Poltava]|nr:aminopeptidase [Erysipelothrix sp. Poltava]